MTILDPDLDRYTEGIRPRPVPPALLAARRDVLATVADLRTIPDDALPRPWAWKGDSEEELRYGFYRIAESFDLAGIDAAATQRLSGVDRGRTADLIAPMTTARWDLQGILAGLPDAAWDADPGGEEWTIRQTMGHVVGGQRGYGVGTAWWQSQGLRVDDPTLPAHAPEAIWDALPTEEAEGAGTPTEVRDRLDAVVDRTTERLAGLPADHLRFGGRWAGFAVDMGFRIGRWSSHIAEHVIQIEKTVVLIDHRPTEIDRLIRHVLAAWGRAEAPVFGETRVDDAMAIVEAAATEARQTAADLARLARA